MDSPNTKISSGNRSLFAVHKNLAVRIITYLGTNSLTKREFRLQSGTLTYKTGVSFTKWDSWIANGTLGLLFTFSTLLKNRIKSKANQNNHISDCNIQILCYNREDTRVRYYVLGGEYSAD